jgi:hypothetical protein
MQIPTVPEILLGLVLVFLARPISSDISCSNCQPKRKKRKYFLISVGPGNTSLKRASSIKERMHANAFYCLHMNTLTGLAFPIFQYFVSTYKVYKQPFPVTQDKVAHNFANSMGNRCTEQ